MALAQPLTAQDSTTKMVDALTAFKVLSFLVEYALEIRLTTNV